jgi:hypothetical protein
LAIEQEETEGIRKANHPATHRILRIRVVAVTAFPAGGLRDYTFYTDDTGKKFGYSVSVCDGC